MDRVHEGHALIVVSAQEVSSQILVTLLLRLEKLLLVLLFPLLHNIRELITISYKYH